MHALVLLLVTALLSQCAVATQPRPGKPISPDDGDDALRARLMALMALCSPSNGRAATLTIAAVLDAVGAPHLLASTQHGDVQAAGRLDYVSWNVSAGVATVAGVLVAEDGAVSHTAAAFVRSAEGFRSIDVLDAFSVDADAARTASLPIGRNGAMFAVALSELSRAVAAELRRRGMDGIVTECIRGVSVRDALLLALADISLFARAHNLSVLLAPGNGPAVDVPVADVAAAMIGVSPSPSTAFRIPPTSRIVHALIAPAEMGWSTARVPFVSAPFSALPFAKPLYVYTTNTSVVQPQPFVGRRGRLPVTSTFSVAAKLPMDATNATRVVAVASGNENVFVDVVIGEANGARAVVVLGDVPLSTRASIAAQVSLVPSALFLDAAPDVLRMSLAGTVTVAPRGMSPLCFGVRGSAPVAADSVALEGPLSYGSWFASVGAHGLDMSANGTRAMFKGVLANAAELFGAVSGLLRLGDVSGQYDMHVATNATDECVSALFGAMSRETSIASLAAAFGGEGAFDGTPALFTSAVSDDVMSVVSGTVYANCAHVSFVAGMSPLPSSFGGSAYASVDIGLYADAVTWLRAVSIAALSAGTLDARPALRNAGALLASASDALAATTTPIRVAVGPTAQFDDAIADIARALRRVPNPTASAAVARVADSVLKMPLVDRVVLQSLSASTAVPFEFALSAVIAPMPSWSISVGDALQLNSTNARDAVFVASTAAGVRYDGWPCSLGLNFIADVNVSALGSVDMNTAVAFAGQQTARVHAALAPANPPFRAFFANASSPSQRVSASDIVASVASDTGLVTLTCVLGVDVAGLLQAPLSLAMEGPVSDSVVSFSGSLAQPLNVPVGEAGLGIEPASSSAALVWNAFGQQVQEAAFTARARVGIAGSLDLSLSLLDAIYAASPLEVNVTTSNASAMDILAALAGPAFARSLGDSSQPVLSLLRSGASLGGVLQPLGASGLSLSLSGSLPCAGCEVTLSSQPVVRISDVFRRLSAQCTRTAWGAGHVVVGRRPSVASVGVCDAMQALAATAAGLAHGGDATLVQNIACDATRASVFVSATEALIAAVAPDAESPVDGIGYVPTWELVRALLPAVNASRGMASSPSPRSPWCVWHTSSTVVSPSLQLSSVWPRAVLAVNATCVTPLAVAVTTLPNLGGSFGVAPSSGGAWVTCAVEPNSAARGVFPSELSADVRVTLVGRAVAAASKLSLVAVSGQPVAVADGMRVAGWSIDAPTDGSAVALSGDLELIVGLRELSLPFANARMGTGVRVTSVVSERASTGSPYRLPIGRVGFPVTRADVSAAWNVTGGAALFGSLVLSVNSQAVPLTLSLNAMGVSAEGRGLPDDADPCGRCAAGEVCAPLADSITGGYACVPADPCAINNGGCGSPYLFSCNATSGNPLCTPINPCQSIPNYCGDKPALASTCAWVEGALPTCFASIQSVVLQGEALDDDQCAWAGVTIGALVQWFGQYTIAAAAATMGLTLDIPASEFVPLSADMVGCTATLYYTASFMLQLALVYPDYEVNMVHDNVLAPPGPISTITALPLSGSNTCAGLDASCPHGTFCSPTLSQGTTCLPIPRRCSFDNGQCGDPRLVECVDGAVGGLQCIPRMPHLSLGGISALVLADGPAAFGDAPHGTRHEILAMPVDGRSARISVDLTAASFRAEGFLLAPAAAVARHAFTVTIAPAVRQSQAQGQQWAATYRASMPSEHTPFGAALHGLKLADAALVLTSGPIELPAEDLSLVRGLSVVGNLTFDSRPELSAIGIVTGLSSAIVAAHLDSLSEYSFSARTLEGATAFEIAAGVAFVPRSLSFRMSNDTASDFVVDGRLRATLGRGDGDVFNGPASLSIGANSAVLLSSPFAWVHPFGTPSLSVSHAVIRLSAPSVAGPWAMSVSGTAELRGGRSVMSSQTLVACGSVSASVAPACSVPLNVPSTTLGELSTLLCPSIPASVAMNRFARHVTFSSVTLTVAPDVSAPAGVVRSVVQGAASGAVLFGMTTTSAQISLSPPAHASVRLEYPSLAFMSGAFTVTGTGNSPVSLSVGVTPSGAAATATVSIANMTLGANGINASPTGNLTIDEAGVRIDLGAAENGLWLPLTLEGLTNKTHPFVVYDFAVRASIDAGDFNSAVTVPATDALGTLLEGLVSTFQSATSQAQSYNATYASLYGQLVGVMATDVNALSSYEQAVPNATSIYYGALNAASSGAQLAAATTSYGPQTLTPYSPSAMGGTGLTAVASGTSTPFASTQSSMLSAAQQQNDGALQSLASLASQVDTLNGMLPAGSTYTFGDVSVNGNLFSAAAYSLSVQMGQQLAGLSYYSGLANDVSATVPALASAYQLLTGGFTAQSQVVANATKTVFVNRKRYYGGEAGASFDCSKRPGNDTELSEAHPLFDARAHEQCMNATWSDIARGSKAVTPEQRPDLARRVRATCAKVSTAQRIKNMCAGGVVRVQVNETVEEGSWAVMWSTSSLPASVQSGGIPLSASSQFPLSTNGPFVAFQPQHAHVLGTVSALSAGTLPRAFLKAVVAGSPTPVPFFADPTSLSASQSAFASALANALQSQSVNN